MKLMFSPFFIAFITRLNLWLCLVDVLHYFASAFQSFSELCIFLYSIRLVRCRQWDGIVMFNWKYLHFKWKHGWVLMFLHHFSYSVSIVLCSIWVLTCWLFIIVTDFFWRLCWVLRGPRENRFGFGCSFSQRIVRENAPKWSFWWWIY